MLTIRPHDLIIVHKILSKHIPSTAQVWAFGSRVKGTARPYSDLDLTIDLHHQPLAYELLVALRDDFEESDLPFKVDIVDWNTIDDKFRSIIHHDRELIL